MRRTLLEVKVWNLSPHADATLYWFIDRHVFPICRADEKLGFVVLSNSRASIIYTGSKIETWIQLAWDGQPWKCPRLLTSRIVRQWTKITIVYTYSDSDILDESSAFAPFGGSRDYFCILNWFRIYCSEATAMGTKHQVQNQLIPSSTEIIHPFIHALLLSTRLPCPSNLRYHFLIMP